MLLEANHLLGAKRRFRMGVAGWRFAHKKDNGRAVVIAILETWPLICTAMVATRDDHDGGHAL